MADKKYNVIISDRAKRELGTSIRFIAQVSKENWYLVLFQIQDDTVYVDHILDCRRDHSLLIK